MVDLKSYLYSINSLRLLLILIFLSKIAWAESLVPFVSLGLPVPASLGVEYIANPELSIFLDLGYCPLPILNLYQIGYSAGHFELWAKWHPWSGSFFVGNIMGYQSILVRKDISMGSLAPDPGPVDTTVNLNSFYLGLGFGWIWKIGSHFYLGVDMGVQVPFVANGGVVINSASAASQDFQSAAMDAAGYFSYYVLPRVNLLRMGWEF